MHFCNWTVFDYITNLIYHSDFCYSQEFNKLFT